MLSRLVHDNTPAFYRMSRLYYQMGDPEDSLRYRPPGSVCVGIMLGAGHREIRECLRLDPDHKECFPFYKVGYTTETLNTCVCVYLCVESEEVGQAAEECQ